MHRRQALGLAGAALAAPLLATGAARAQDAWPIRQVRVVIPFAAGGPQDIPARIIAERLSRTLGATFIVENRPGVGGGLGAQMVANSAPDGGTLLFISSSVAILPTLQKQLNFDPRRDLAPLTVVCDVPAGLMVRIDSRFDSLASLLAEAKANPGKLTYGSGGVGSANHLAGAQFAALAGIETVHVPYRGISQAVNAIYTGEIDYIFGSSVEVLAHYRQGRARLLGMTMPQRVPAVPEIPAIAEQVPGFTAPNWFAMFAPKGMPAPLMQRLVAELKAMHNDEVLVSRLGPAAAIVRMDGPEALAAQLAAEIPRWEGVIRSAGINPQG
ncbi:Bug family tripartite tricarboxylate transporter substrate binding protein [Falsiroseomonas selenitidurans]|uniref:Tripartite tricarboxylate transporter substrate binding protein n=1 Tax=Falsiroseomonas selenitidurans TaxID=2716335 RepID=A0ABX1DZ24_9PROT|nr:tripartite tricarboxylate transporter substrate-binding protein [Falsiroseomonas selenitidurans]NKC29625.1 tripartite tricarboxylate transporter substrate binding protein [Falsiroseomonas selenitidurans]